MRLITALALSATIVLGSIVQAQPAEPLVEATRLMQIIVAGEVQRPGSFPVEPGATVADVLTLAGGLARTPSTLQIVVLRDGVESAVDVLAILSPGTKPDFVLREGDVLLVRRNPNRISIYGHVKVPGEYAFANKSEMTLLRAIALAGGLRFSLRPLQITLSQPKPGGTVEQRVLPQRPLTTLWNEPLPPGTIIFVQDAGAERTMPRQWSLPPLPFLPSSPRPSPRPSLPQRWPGLRLWLLENA